MNKLYMHNSITGISGFQNGPNNPFKCSHESKKVLRFQLLELFS